MGTPHRSESYTPTAAPIVRRLMHMPWSSRRKCSRVYAASAFGRGKCERRWPSSLCARTSGKRRRNAGCERRYNDCTRCVADSAAACASRRMAPLPSCGPRRAPARRTGLRGRCPWRCWVRTPLSRLCTAAACWRVTAVRGAPGAKADSSFARRAQGRAARTQSRFFLPRMRGVPPAELHCGLALRAGVPGAPLVRRRLTARCGSRERAAWFLASCSFPALLASGLLP
jgi:hypothetical protein